VTRSACIIFMEKLPEYNLLAKIAKEGRIVRIVQWKRLCGWRVKEIVFTSSSVVDLCIDSTKPAALNSRKI
jgi:hypothetical protein